MLRRMGNEREENNNNFILFNDIINLKFKIKKIEFCSILNTTYCSFLLYQDGTIKICKQ